MILFSYSMVSRKRLQPLLSPGGPLAFRDRVSLRVMGEGGLTSRRVLDNYDNYRTSLAKCKPDLVFIQ